MKAWWDRLVRRVAQRYCGHDLGEFDRLTKNIAASARRARIDAGKAEKRRAR